MKRKSREGLKRQGRTVGSPSPLEKNSEFAVREEFALGFSIGGAGWGRLWRSRALGFYAILPLLMAVVFFIGVLWLAHRNICIAGPIDSSPTFSRFNALWSMASFTIRCG